jgi:hypothetical protein
MAPRPPTLLRDWEDLLVDPPPPRLSLLAPASRVPLDVDCPSASLDRLQALEAPALVSVRPSLVALQASAALPQALAAGEDPPLVDLLASLLLAHPQVSADLPASEDPPASPLAVADLPVSVADRRSIEFG